MRGSLFGPFQMHLHAVQLAAGNPHGGHDLLFGHLALVLAPLNHVAAGIRASVVSTK